MFYQLPPVGNPVCLARTEQPEYWLQSFFEPYQPRYYASGTAALAVAITASIQLKNAERPEVILPAYGCPDLISATLYAGAIPVLVDLEPDRPWMNLEQVSAEINSETVSIVAVDLFGIPERMSALRTIAGEAEALLIEDSAQAFPGGNEADIWDGDIVVLSFGRGKPVSLLGGGAILFREEAWGGLLPKSDVPADSSKQQILFRLKAALYNRVIHPRLYWLMQKLPFLHLGETHYHPLTGINEMSSIQFEILPSNIVAYSKDEMVIQHAMAGMMEDACLEVDSIINLPAVCSVTPERKLLRYPLLVDTTIYDELYQRLQRSGLGPSRMYPAALPGISGLASLLEGQGSFPSAESFASRILTLPTHNHLRQENISNIREALSSL